MHAWMDIHDNSRPGHAWRSEKSWQLLVLSFYHVGSGDQTPVVRLKLGDGPLLNELFHQRKISTFTVCIEQVFLPYPEVGTVPCALRIYSPERNASTHPRNVRGKMIPTLPWAMKPSELKGIMQTAPICLEMSVFWAYPVVMINAHMFFIVSLSLLWNLSYLGIIAAQNVSKATTPVPKEPRSWISNSTLIPVTGRLRYTF